MESLAISFKGCDGTYSAENLGFINILRPHFGFYVKKAIFPLIHKDFSLIRPFK